MSLFYMSFRCVASFTKKYFKGFNWWEIGELIKLEMLIWRGFQNCQKGIKYC